MRKKKKKKEKTRESREPRKKERHERRKYFFQNGRNLTCFLAVFESPSTTNENLTILGINKVFFYIYIYIFIYFIQ